MKHFNILVLTAAFFMNVSLSADDSNSDTIENLTAKLAMPELVGLKRANCFLNLGNALSVQDNFDDAETQYTAALAMPELVGEFRAITHYNLGVTHYRQNNFAAAITQYTAALVMPELVGLKRERIALLIWGLTIVDKRTSLMP